MFVNVILHTFQDGMEQYTQLRKKRGRKRKIDKLLEAAAAAAAQQQAAQQAQLQAAELLKAQHDLLKASASKHRYSPPSASAPPHASTSRSESGESSYLLLGHQRVRLCVVFNKQDITTQCFTSEGLNASKMSFHRSQQQSTSHAFVDVRVPCETRIVNSSVFKYFWKTEGLRHQRQGEKRDFFDPVLCAFLAESSSPFKTRESR